MQAKLAAVSGLLEKLTKDLEESNLSVQGKLNRGIALEVVVAQTACRERLCVGRT